MQPGRADFLTGALIKRGHEYFQYEISDVYDASISGFSGDYEYYGYVASNGAYIIQQHQISSGKYRYNAGTSATTYATYVAFKDNLTALGNLTWSTYDTIFS